MFNSPLDSFRLRAFILAYRVFGVLGVLGVRVLVGVNVVHFYTVFSVIKPALVALRGLMV